MQGLRALVLAVVMVCHAAPPARADHIEITIALSAAPGEVVTTLGGATATVVFDTEAPPIESDAQTVTFAGVSGRIDAVFYSAPPVTNPSVANASPTSIRGAVTGSELEYSQAGNGSMTVRLFLGSATLTLTVLSPAGPFLPSMTSLPDSPASYRVANELMYTVFAGLVTPGSGVFASIQRSNSVVASIGGVSYNVRLVDPPAPDPCAPADLAEPFGVLDFSDVFAFLVAFGSGCP